VQSEVEVDEGQSTSAIRYQYDNHLGSASLELDNTGNIISYEEYHPFGTTSYRSGKTVTETSQKRYKYNGKECDNETGLYYYGARYYAPWICRFVSVDPLQFDYPYYTPFQYAGNKPITYIDLDGLEEAPNPIFEDVKRRANNLFRKVINWGINKCVSSFLKGKNQDVLDKDDVEDEDDKIITYNKPKTPKDPYLSVKGDLKVGAHSRKSSILMGLGEKLELGVSQEITSVEFVGNTKEAYLNINVANKNPELTLKIREGVIGGGGTISIPVNPISDDDILKKTGEFSVGPFKFIVPLNKNEKPTVEIVLIDISRNVGKGLSVGFLVDIKNIKIMTTQEVTEAYKQSYNQIQNHYYFVKMREQEIAKQKEAEELKQKLSF